MTRRLLVATGSEHKLSELSALLDVADLDLVSLRDLGIPADVAETGETFEANAILKARAYAERSGLPTLADDSGLEVDALGGAPGVRSHRYAGDDATDDANYERLLAALAGVPDERRTARYRCVLVLADPRIERDPLVVDGVLEGRVGRTARGSNGFGYDPVFEPETEPVGGRTVAEMTPEEKNAISHRAEAARRMRPHLLRLA